MTHPPSAPRARRPLARAAAAALLFVGCALGTAGADVVILKDGFVIQGNVRKEMEKIVDKASGQSFTVPAARGFDIVDEGPKFVIFSSNSKQLGEINKDIKIRPDYRAYSTKFESRGNRPPPFGSYEKMADFDAKWRRTLKVRVPEGGFDLVEQQITSLDPYKCMVYSTTHAWRQAYRTVELGPERTRRLLLAHPEFAEAPGKPDPAKRLTIARFLKDAGWLLPAKQEVEDIKKLFPAGLPKEAGEQADALLKEIDQGFAEAVVQESEMAIAAGRYDGAGKLLAEFPDKTADPKDVVKAAALRAQQKAAVERTATAKRLLRSLIDRTTGGGDVGPSAAVGGGPGAAVAYLRGPRPGVQVALLLAAAEKVYAEIHPDSAARLEDFVQFMEQAERERSQGQELTKTPEKLLAAAVSGWVKGKGGAVEVGTAALRLWAAREVVLEYVRTDDLNTRNQLLRKYRQEVGLPPDELAQVIALLPPAEPDDLNARGGKPVPAGNGVPPGVFRRATAASTAHPQGIDYLVRLPAEYHHGRAYPVIVALTDASGPPEIIMAALAFEADRHGYIVAAPDWSKAGPDWKYRGEDHTYATETLRDVIRHFSVDNNRVFLIGGGTGANMALDVGCSHPDLFAGVLAMVPSPNNFLVLHYCKNAQKLPVYAVTGETTAGLAPLRRMFESWMPKGYPAIMSVYKGRGAEWFGSEVPVMFDWMSRKQRADWRAVLQLDPDRTTPPWQVGRPTDTRFYWLGVGSILDARRYDPEKSPKASPALISGDIKGNHIILDGNGARKVTVWLTRDMIDWTKPLLVSVARRVPLTASIGGGPPTKWKPERIEPNLEVLLNEFAERGDRRTVFLQKIEFPMSP